jgi:hypothetical protein
MDTKTDAIDRLHACYNMSWLRWDSMPGEKPKEHAAKMRASLKRIAMMAAKGENTEDVFPYIEGFQPPRPEDPDSPADVEALASAHHESWAGWTRYMLDRIESDMSPTEAAVLRSLPCVKRWMRQMDTAYEDLPEEEKKSDRTEVAKHLPDYRPWYYTKEEREKRLRQRRVDSGIPLPTTPVDR